MAKPGKERTREWRERLLALGFKRYEVIVHIDDQPTIRTLVQKLERKRLDALRVKQKGEKL